MSMSSSFYLTNATAPQREKKVRLFNVYLTLILPFLILWNLLSYPLAFFLSPLLCLCGNHFASNVYETAPFLEHIWRQHGAVNGRILRFFFDWALCFNFTRRYLTCFMRRELPSFYIVGFPKAGTTTLANYLRQCPGVANLDGLLFHETLCKESHFFLGSCGRSNAHQGWRYAAYFPTLIARWFWEVLCGVDRFQVFDACPLYAVLPHVAARMKALTPEAKIIVCLRNPSDMAFSSFNMFSAFGIDPGWSYLEQVSRIDSDPRFAEAPEDTKLWRELEALDPTAPLPKGLMRRFYEAPTTPIRVGRMVERIQPLLRHFRKDQFLFVNFDELVQNEEGVVRSVLKFVGAAEHRYAFRKQAPGMKSEYAGSRMHPSVVGALHATFVDSNQRLYRLLGRDLGFDQQDSAA